MALIKATLRTQIQIFSDQLHPLFEGFPKNIPDNAEKWADAIDLFASVVNPSSSETTEARQAFLDEMNLLTKPESEDPNALPFTIYYKSSELRLLLFNRYLTDKLGYKPNPQLDKTKTFTILNNIRNTYNSLYPILALTDDDIYYNQSRFNDIYALEIIQQKKFTLLSDGVTINTNGLQPKYFHIPVNRDGVLIPLQVDGIIGDDTIRYQPLINFAVYQQTNNIVWNNKYSTIKFITQPSESGEVFVSVPFKNTNKDWFVQLRYSNFKFKRDFIDKNICRDYTKFKIEKTQFQIDGGTFSQSNDSVSKYIKIFEANHSKSDKFWKDNGISSLSEFETFSKKKKKDYDALPTDQTDGLKVLEKAIIAYAHKLAEGMAPTYTASPNSIPISLTPVKAVGVAGGSNAACIEVMVNLITLYFKTGFATNNSSGLTINWS